MAEPRAVPRYLRIADALRARIRAGRWRQAERLPSEHALCRQFRVSRMTVRQALDILRHEGLLSRHVGRGTFTSPVPAERRLRVIGSVEDMLALGEETWFKPLERMLTAAAPDASAALRLAPGALVARFTGIRYGDDGPFQHVTAYVPAAIGRRILEADLSATSVIGTVERELGLAVKYLEQAIEVMRCPRGTARLLAVAAGSPILRFRRTYFTASGEPVEHAVTFHWAGRYPYAMMLFRSETTLR
ncbi:MAG: GntR family transcriptional regulator [Candidatus Rokubacteria bacterium]|nr:GntR family transcriptional regulator [Candidatus Rokubacteria bacterium]